MAHRSSRRVQSEDMQSYDDWETCDVEAAVAALSARYRFSRANAVQLLRDGCILSRQGQRQT